METSVSNRRHFKINYDPRPNHVKLGRPMAGQRICVLLTDHMPHLEILQILSVNYKKDVFVIYLCHNHALNLPHNLKLGLHSNLIHTKNWVLALDICTALSFNLFFSLM